ncbi:MULTISPECIES: hypothetical protein [Sphingomonas]|uniref:hypothetical protein n=1 Tax=Sphingomonas TaxID=13687 RepID=UPI000DEEF027|nr:MULTISPECIES: hypothetical protein [Sphingomonas]
MQQAFIPTRAALRDAQDLVERFGDNAGLEAAIRAEASRDRDNFIRFCHWRQIERVIVTLTATEPDGTIH